MVRTGWSVVCALGVVLACCGGAGPTSAPTTAPVKAFEDVLKAKGLTRVGRTYLLEADAKFPDALRRLLTVKKQADDDTAKRAAMEKDVRTAKATLADLEPQYRDLNEQFLKKKKNDVYHRNQLAAEISALGSRIRDVTRYQSDREAELARMTGEPQDKYAAAVMTLGEEMEGTLKRYEALAGDAEVTAALRRLDEKDPAKLGLGPSEQFKREVVFVRNQRGKVATGVVKFTYDTGTPRVVAELNGSVTVQMIVDTGASYVSIPWETAKRLGMSPGAGDPTIQVSIANGKTVDVRLMTLKRVRVGQFTAENVACVVTPASAGETPFLLGGSFLKNFIYRMDVGARELHLTQVSSKPDAPAGKVETMQPAAGARTMAGSGPKAEDGFTPLFNGKDLTGWSYGVTDQGEQKVGEGFRVRDGAIYCTSDDGGRLYTERDYANFVLRLEFKLSDSANNGIAIRSPPTGDPAYRGMKVQILDNTGKQHTDKAGRSKLKPEQLHGSIYDVVAAKPGYLKPVGEWNTQEIRADGKRVTVLLNGNVILSSDLDSITDETVLKRHPGLKNEKGRIGLLGHGAAVEFRNMRIKEL